MKKKLMWFVGSMVCLSMCFLLCVFLEPDRAIDWPLILFVFGLFAVVISSKFNGRMTMICTPLGYISGFVIGAIFNFDREVDVGGGNFVQFNNQISLWTNTYLLFILAGIVLDIAFKCLRKYRNKT